MDAGSTSPLQKRALENKLAIVTGAASGIGASIASSYLATGATVIGVDLNSAGLDSLLRTAPVCSSFIPLRADVSKEQEVRDVIDTAAARFDGIDILVNNAGIEIIQETETLNQEQWDAQINVNLKAAFLFAKYAVPLMRGRNAAIINIASVHAFVSYSGFAAYDASKAGLLGLTRCLAVELGRDLIRVNAICPGYIDAPLLQKWLATFPDPQSAIRRIVSFHPLGRIGTPEDVAEVAVFLASPQASFITGTSITVDGGMTSLGH